MQVKSLSQSKGGGVGRSAKSSGGVGGLAGSVTCGVRRRQALSNGETDARPRTSSSGPSLQLLLHESPSHLPRSSTMETEPQQLKEWEGVLSALNGFIEASENMEADYFSLLLIKVTYPGVYSLGTLK